MTPDEIEKALAAAQEKLTQLGPNRLTAFNTWVTIATAIATAMVGLVLKVGQDGIERGQKNIENDVAKIKKREQIVEESYKFAQAFLSQGKDYWSQNPRSVQLAIAALNIIAEASASDEGQSSAEDRAVLPIHMALLLDDPASIAAMDRNLAHLRTWIVWADQDDQSRLTAIKALRVLCCQAIADRKLRSIENCVDQIETLLQQIDPNKNERSAELFAAALAEKTNIITFLKGHNDDLNSATLENGDGRDRQAIVDKIQRILNFDKTVNKLQNAKLDISRLQNKADVQSDDAKGTEQRKAQTEETLRLTNEALAAAGAAQSKASRSESQTVAASSGPTTSALVDQDKHNATCDLIDKLLSNDQQVKSQARSSLALLGEESLPCIVAEIKRRNATNTEEDNAMRLELATALSLMKQPVVLKDDSPQWIVSLLRCQNKKVRTAAADFLMDLWDGESIRSAFAELRKLIEPNPVPDGAGGAVYSAALVTATWARNLNDNILGPDPNAPDKKMNQVALAKAKDWRQSLNQPQFHDQWSATVKMLNELILRAERRQQTSS